MVISVKQSHIDKSVELLKDKNIPPSSICPVALAVKEEFPCERVGVGFSVVNVGDRTFSFPANVILKIEKFDKTRIMEPFDFVMNELI